LPFHFLPPPPVGEQIAEVVMKTKMGKEWLKPEQSLCSITAAERDRRRKERGGGSSSSSGGDSGREGRYLRSSSATRSSRYQ